MSSDECRRRGRRTGAEVARAAATAVSYRYSGDQQRPLPPFPSVGRLIEKHTMLIERHQQKQNGLTPTAARRKPTPSPAADAVRVHGPTAGPADDSSNRSSPQSKSDGPAPGDGAAAWDRLRMDDDGDAPDDGDYEEPTDDSQRYRHRRRHRPSRIDDNDQRFICESLNSFLPGKARVAMAASRVQGRT